MRPTDRNRCLMYHELLSTIFCFDCSEYQSITPQSEDENRFTCTLKSILLLFQASTSILLLLAVLVLVPTLDGASLSISKRAMTKHFFTTTSHCRYNRSLADSSISFFYSARTTYNYADALHNTIMYRAGR
jgi:hypothetical protein